MKRTLIVIIATAACTMLVACSNTTVILNKKNELTIKKNGSSLFYSAQNLAAKSKKDFDAICKHVLESAPKGIDTSRTPTLGTASTSAPDTVSTLTLDLSNVSDILKEGKGIIDLFPVNSVDWSGECPRQGGSASSGSVIPDDAEQG